MPVVVRRRSTFEGDELRLVTTVLALEVLLEWREAVPDHGEILAGAVHQSVLA